ncbi:beta-lactamase family protein [Streptomyces sp. M2CJ-2]|uniref:serine hydrolase domain-containing protein n=1 Tax=Streptomyces sp. M2CJ-2 TaxID=2803948 RepID=UPI0019289D35|nr:serine hydrolase domain-containing protein [Streptomyces sp. M2CJ-2]MBL3667573.1 beta-lactamase family protein [Streptomyces sp. M2CJ-2]
MGVEVHGTVTEGFEPVEEAFARNFEHLGDRGAAVAVYRDGHRVVDLWGGVKNANGTDGTDGAEPWRRGTAQVVRSATKGVAAAALLLLHQYGELDLDAPVGHYWPEFKAHGKERVLVRHVLNHRAGLPLLDRPLTPAEALDPLRGAEALAAQAPVWEPGTDHGYHALTYGWLLDELVRRVTGRGAGEWIADRIAAPLGLEFWLGLPAAEAGRVGRVGPVEGPEPSGALRARPKRSVTAAYDDPASVTRRAFAAISPFPDPNDPASRAVAQPAANGIATADGLARFYASLIGRVDGVRLFDPATVARARAEESAGPDRVLIVGTRFGLGYMLHGSASPFLAPGSFGHPGRGGSLGFADPESGIAFGYVTNGFRTTVTSDPRAQALVRAVRSALAG